MNMSCWKPDHWDFCSDGLCVQGAFSADSSDQRLPIKSDLFQDLLKPWSADKEADILSTAPCPPPGSIRRICNMNLRGLACDNIWGILKRCHETYHYKELGNRNPPELENCVSIDRACQRGENTTHGISVPAVAASRLIEGELSCYWKAFLIVLFSLIGVVLLVCVLPRVIKCKRSERGLPVRVRLRKVKGKYNITSSLRRLISKTSEPEQREMDEMAALKSIKTDNPDIYRQLDENDSEQSKLVDVQPETRKDNSEYSPTIHANNAEGAGNKAPYDFKFIDLNGKSEESTLLESSPEKDSKSSPDIRPNSDSKYSPVRYNHKDIPAASLFTDNSINDTKVSPSFRNDNSLSPNNQQYIGSDEESLGDAVLRKLDAKIEDCARLSRGANSAELQASNNDRPVKPPRHSKTSENTGVTT